MRRILIVDKDMDFLGTLKSALKKLHYNVIVTNACREVMDILFFFNADLIFIGVGADKEEAISLCRQLRSRLEYQQIPLVLLSEEDDTLRSYKRLGATGALRRPFEMADLVRTAQIYIKQ